MLYIKKTLVIIATAVLMALLAYLTRVFVVNGVQETDIPAQDPTGSENCITCAEHGQILDKNAFLL